MSWPGTPATTSGQASAIRRSLLVLAPSIVIVGIGLNPLPGAQQKPDPPGQYDMPAVATPVGDWIGFHTRTGSHGIDDYNWAQFLNFADRHFGIARAPK